MQDNPRPKTVRLVPGSDDEILSRVYTYSPLLGSQTFRVRTAKSGRRYKQYLYAVITGVRGSKTIRKNAWTKAEATRFRRDLEHKGFEVNQSGMWRRPWTGGRSDKFYPFYTQIRVFNNQGGLMLDAVLALGDYLPTEIASRADFTGAVRNAFARDVMSKFGEYHPSRGLSLARIGKIVIVRRFRHRYGVPAYKGKKR